MLFSVCCRNSVMMNFNYFLCRQFIIGNRWISIFSQSFKNESKFQSQMIFLKSNKFSLYDITSCRQMAGHAKWQNIKHIKAEKDRKKQILCNRYARLVALAVREKGPDPKINHKLATILEDAKKNNVPSSTLENAMKTGNKKTKIGTIEVLGPGGCFLVLDYEAENISTMRHDIKVICKKYSANMLSTEGRWRAVYEQKGIIKAVSELGGQPVDAEKALDAAIEAGAEEVHTKGDENDKTYLEFLCAAEDLHKIKKELERHYEIEEAYIGYIPSTTVKLSEEDLTLADHLLEELGDLQEVVRIYENVQ
ncbi:Translational activator of cytochrome c oxidase 1, partial [Stegodyphus mimosarum]